jgi:hypothetical protein
MTVCAVEESSQKPGAADFSLSASRRVDFLSTSKVLLDVSELGVELV